MEIGGLQKTTLIDYPGKVACTVFLEGCNFACPWCYSPELKKYQNPAIPRERFFSFLKKRKGQLEGVVICGGEPTINPDLPEFCSEIKQAGYLVKLDTNGSNFKMLKQLTVEKQIDYVAMDIKAPLEKYYEAIGVSNESYLANVEESIEFLKQDNIDYEFRTTFVPKILESQDIIDIADWIGPAKKYYIQNFVPQKTLDPVFAKLNPHPEEEVLKIKQAIASLFEVCEIR